jgi:peroxiredoxin
MECRPTVEAAEKFKTGRLMRRWAFRILALFSITALLALVWHQLISRGTSPKRHLVENSTPDERPDGPGETSRPRLFVLAINGGASPRKNFFSHLVNLQELVDLLHSAGVPSDRITVLAGDGNDPEPDLVLREEGLGPEAWRLTGTAVEEYFSPRQVMGNSEVRGATLYPATKASLSIWLLTVGQQLHAGDTLLLYVTDHGSRGADVEDNKITLWGYGPGQGLSVRELRDSLATLDSSIRVVALMSQCYSGGFAALADIDILGKEPTGRFCGFFSTTADRMSYGSYPETQDKPKVGHSFAFLQALSTTSGSFTLSHELALETDETPDVPVRTSDLFLGAPLAKAAQARQVSVVRLVDDLLQQAWAQPAAFANHAQRLQRLAAQFGLPTLHSRAAAASWARSMEGQSAALEHLASEINRAMEEMNRKDFTRFVASRSEWRGSLDPTVLKAMDAAGRSRLCTQLASGLAAFSQEGGDGKAHTAKEERDTLYQLAFHMKVRAAVLLRMVTVLNSVAGLFYVNGHPAERATWQKLVDCEALDLKLPRTTEGPRGPALPSLDEDLARVNSIREQASASGFLNQPDLRLGEPAPELPMVPYWGEIPSVGSGKPLLLFFWSVWCRKCGAAAREVWNIARRRDIAVLAITSDSESALDHFFAHREGFPSPVSRDPGRQIMFRYGVRELPAFVLLDGRGRVASTVMSSLEDLPVAIAQ